MSAAAAASVVLVDELTLDFFVHVEESVVIVVVNVGGVVGVNGVSGKGGKGGKAGDEGSASCFCSCLETR